VRRTDQYVVDGVRVPSVTEALKIAGLGADFGMVAPDVLETARKRGELVHQLTELIDLGHLDPADPVDDDVQGYINAYLQFKEDAGFVVRAVEKVVVNASHRYAGTIDRVGQCKKLQMPGRRTVDIKCVAQVSPATRLQVAGYAEAEDVPLWSSLQLMPNGRYKHVEYSEPSDKYDFLSCVRVAHFKLAHGLAQLEDS
jgi:hypothetical protein